MRRQIILGIVSALIFATTTISFAQSKPEVLTNAQVIQLVQMGLSEDIILEKINRSECHFDTSTAALGRLHTAKVPNNVIRAMLLAGDRNGASVTPNSTAVPQPMPPKVNQEDEEQAAITNAYKEYGVRFFQFDGTKRRFMIPDVPVAIQTNAKGDDIKTIAGDAALNQIKGEVINRALEGAVQAELSSGVMSHVPVVGAVIAGAMMLPGLRHDPVITNVYALEGPHSKNLINSATPHFDVSFTDVVGANPDNFVPELIRIHPTDNNWRLAYAEKSKTKIGKNVITQFHAIEEVIPSKIEKRERGVYTLEPSAPLTPGEYGLVFRPIAGDYKFVMADMLNRKGEGMLLSLILDFSVGASENVNPSVKAVPPTNMPKEPAGKPSETALGTPQANALPVYGTILDVKGMNRVYIDAVDSKSRELITKDLAKNSALQVVGDPAQAQFILEYRVLHRETTASGDDKDTRERGQLSAVTFREGKRIVAWSDSAEFARLLTGGIGFRTTTNETKLTERFLKVMK